MLELASQSSGQRGDLVGGNNVQAASVAGGELGGWENPWFPVQRWGPRKANDMAVEKKHECLW